VCQKRLGPEIVTCQGVMRVDDRERERETEKERKRERGFFDNQEVTERREAQRPVGQHRLWAHGLQHVTASTIPLFSVWPCGTPLRTRGVSDLHQSVPIT
jgi:hypothetical protein